MSPKWEMVARGREAGSSSLEMESRGRLTPSFEPRYWPRLAGPRLELTCTRCRVFYMSRQPELPLHLPLLSHLPLPMNLQFPSNLTLHLILSLLLNLPLPFNVRTHWKFYSVKSSTGKKYFTFNNLSLPLPQDFCLQPMPAMFKGLTKIKQASMDVQKVTNVLILRV